MKKLLLFLVTFIGIKGQPYDNLTNSTNGNNSMSSILQKTLDIPQNQLLNNLTTIQQNSSAQSSQTTVITQVGVPEFPGGVINFNITEEQLQKDGCLKFNKSALIQWQCNFVITFNVQDLAIVSYYFTFRVDQNFDKLTNTTSIPKVDFIKMTNFTTCPTIGNGSTVCRPKVKVETALQYCSDQNCTSTQTVPFKPLSINTVFYLIHYIVDQSFASEWTLQDILVTYQSFGFSLTWHENQISIITRVPGYNIYKLTVPIVAPDVIITASATLKNADNDFDEDDNIYVSNQAIATGPVTANLLPKIRTVNKLQTSSLVAQNK